MASTSSANNAPQITNNAPLVTSSPITNPHVPNPHSYLLFDLRLIPTYTNHQLQYYHLSGAMLSIVRAMLKTKMAECKADLELLDWDGNTHENTPISTPLVTPAPLSSSCTLSLDNDSKVDSNCPEAPLGQRGIKFNISLEATMMPAKASFDLENCGFSSKFTIKLFIPSSAMPHLLGSGT